MEQKWYRKGPVIPGFVMAAATLIAALLVRGSSAPTITVSPVLHSENQTTAAPSVLDRPAPSPASIPAPHTASLATDLDDSVGASPPVPRRPRMRAVPATLTLVENHPLTPAGIPAALSVKFGSVAGAEFVTLVIAPFGEPAAPHAILEAGANIPFHSSRGDAFNAQVLSIDSAAHTVVVRIDRLLHRSAE